MPWTSTYQIVCDLKMGQKNTSNYLNKQQMTGSCGMTLALSLIGGRWKLNILAQLLQHESLRFSMLKFHIPLISEKMLTQQLNELIRDGLVAKTVVTSRPLQVEYQLTTGGKSLEQVLMALYNWGEALRNE